MNRFIGVIILSAMLLNGCATVYTVSSANDVRYRKQTALSEKIIAVGKPKSPIPSHPYAMVLVGETHSILVNPTPSAKIPQNLFNQIFDKVDLNYLYLTTTNDGTSKSLELDMGKDPVGMPKINQEVRFLFSKPRNLIKTNEQKTLENLGFDCQTHNDNSANLICTQMVNTSFTLAQKVQNAHNIPYRFKEPLVIHFNYKQSHKQPARLLLTPLALVLDVITLPIIIPVAGMVAYGLSQWDGT
ncbi:hypothetical protein [Moraxella oblonga]|uniref:hypothetical protein n=1 Tax=Moraxella oblonga TaxID=200413 RepID=UPI000835A5AB|nr:hypothetical protein [Moraxella oblonga]